MSWYYIGTVAVGVATNVLTDKLIGQDAKPTIGSGTSPSLEPGPTPEYTAVEGSEVQPFGGFEETDFIDPKPDPAGAEMMLQALAEAGIRPGDLDQHGIPGMVAGGYLRRAPGGFIGPPAPINLQMSQPQMPQIDLSMPEVPESTPFAHIIDWYQSLDPDMQDLLMKSAEKVGIAGLTRVVSGKEEKPGSLVSTQTLPGNAARRRQAQMNIKPIVGSSFADGGVLNRPMFMPKGGEMYGRGGPKDDLIPVMASNGEYMLSKAAVDQAGGGNHARGIATLNAFNRAGNRRYG
jgi:hypothetical protein